MVAAMTPKPYGEPADWNAAFNAQLTRFRNLDRAHVICKARRFQQHNVRSRRKFQSRRRIAMEFPVHEDLGRIDIGRNRQIAESL